LEDVGAAEEVGLCTDSRGGISSESESGVKGLGLVVDEAGGFPFGVEELLDLELEREFAALVEGFDDELVEFEEEVGRGGGGICPETTLDHPRSSMKNEMIDSSCSLTPGS
jgi:hypothetical protein